MLVVSASERKYVGVCILACLRVRERQRACLWCMRASVNWGVRTCACACARVGARHY